jgi:FlaA1/EpsC-like NDP-sugar epimerase
MQMQTSLNGLNKWGKRGVAFASDITMTTLTLIAAGWISNSTGNYTWDFGNLLTLIFLQCAIYLLCGLHRGVWRYASIPDLVRILKAILIGVGIIAIFSNLKGTGFSAKFYITYVALLIILLSAPRLLYRWLRDHPNSAKQGKRILIVGAGSAGNRLIRDLCRLPPTAKLIPVGLVDDDVRRLGCEIHGIRIFGPCEDIPRLVQTHNIDLIFIAIPSAGSIRMREIFSYCEAAKVPVRTLPTLKEITDGKVNIASLREVLLEDLLGREQVTLDWDEIKQTIMHKTILVTGGGGSIGSELCRQISRLSPKKLIIIDNNEFNLYSIDAELKKDFGDVAISIHLCSVTDETEMKKIFYMATPELVFHVAAYKHVPLLENHLRVAMYNNIIGTRITAELAVASGVDTFVLISTDKAVNPTNIMGATKRASEIFCQNFNLHSTTKFTTVRFGNVLDSTGSVIPLFRKQLARGGPLTVTHPKITRYFMTIPEASQLILQAVTMNRKGEIFVLDMGEPINISYLAEQLIKLSGKIVDKDISIEYIGLRPGEKLHEELFHHGEDIQNTIHPKIMRATVRYNNWARLQNCIDEIDLACKQNNIKQLQILLLELVPEYTNLSNQTPPVAIERTDFSYV